MPIYIPNPQDALHEWEIRQYRQIAKAVLFPVLPEETTPRSLSQASAPSNPPSGDDDSDGFSPPRHPSPNRDLHPDVTVRDVVGTPRHLPVTSTPAQWGDPLSSDSDLDSDFQRLPRNPSRLDPEWRGRTGHGASVRRNTPGLQLNFDKTGGWLSRVAESVGGGSDDHAHTLSDVIPVNSDIDETLPVQTPQTNPALGGASWRR